MHAGVLKDRNTMVMIKILPGMTFYQGTLQYEIQSTSIDNSKFSSSEGKYDGSEGSLDHSELNKSSSKDQGESNSNFTGSYNDGEFQYESNNNGLVDSGSKVGELGLEFNKDTRDNVGQENFLE